MERTILIINTFANLIKMEHHRSFLEFCNVVNVVPLGLHLKKTPSMMGAPSEDFLETWSGVLKEAQTSLLTLLIIHYRDRLEKDTGQAYHLLTSLRMEFTKQEMEHVREQLSTQWKLLGEKRTRKAKKLCELNAVPFTTELIKKLETRIHTDNPLFEYSDLEEEREVVEEESSTEEVRDTAQAVEEDENGRLIGRFVSGSVVNLSRRELSKEDISLLSKGLKFSPTPTDIDKSQLKSDIEAYKRKMRLKWFFRNEEKEDDTDENNFRIKSTWQPPRMTLFLKTIFRCWRRRYCLSRRRVRTLIISLLLKNFL